MADSGFNWENVVFSIAVGIFIFVIWATAWHISHQNAVGQIENCESKVVQATQLSIVYLFVTGRSFK